MKDKIEIKGSPRNFLIVASFDPSNFWNNVHVKFRICSGLRLFARTNICWDLICWVCWMSASDNFLLLYHWKLEVPFGFLFMFSGMHLILIPVTLVAVVGSWRALRTYFLCPRYTMKTTVFWAIKRKGIKNRGRCSKLGHVTCKVCWVTDK